ncbi:MAG: hypothetical protein L6Q57_03545 [Alphaproteobacteria bacterium]|nr:hypothetical protein [Alphaproteobacteria bacterium]
MKWALYSILIFTLISGLIFVPATVRATAQEAPVAGPDISSDPVCFSVRNTAAYKVYGTFGTDYYTTPDGTKARHRANFRLDPAGSTDPEKGTPTDRADFCSYGPFFKGKTLELTLRTLVPIFSCQTRIDQGEIIIKGERTDDGTKTWAECFQ